MIAIQKNTITRLLQHIVHTLCIKFSLTVYTSRGNKKLTENLKKKMIDVRVIGQGVRLISCMNCK